MRKPTKEEESFFKENLRYDPETGELWWIKPGIISGAGKPRSLNKPVGSLSNGYLIFGLPKAVTGNRLWIPRVHRVVWFLYYGNWPDKHIDHINGDKKDNRVENLRLVSTRENLRNRRSHKNSSSKYKGVSWHVRELKWQVHCSDGVKSCHLGIYKSEEEAARAYDKAARAWHGEYARLNFPEKHEQGATHGHDL